MDCDGWREDLKDQFDDVLVQSYGYRGNGKQLFPPHTPLYNKFVGGVLAAVFIAVDGIYGSTRLRNIRVGRPAIANRLHIGEVARFEARTRIHNLEGRKTNTWCSTLRVKGGHHEGRNEFARGCSHEPPLPKYCRIVEIDTCKFPWCSVDSAAFHSSVWPRNVKKAEGIARTLFTNQCDWVDVLIVRGRCFSSNKVSFRANSALEHLHWNWFSMRRPCVVYQEGNDATSNCDLVISWCARECVHRGGVSVTW